MPKLNIHKCAMVVWLAMALALVACAGPWKKAPDKLSEHPWSITSPEGWMHLSTHKSKMLSKDGPYLDYILIQSRPLYQRFRYTNQKLSPDMLPHETAQLITDNMRSDPLIRQFRLLDSEPAMVAGYEGFKLVYTYQDTYGVEIKSVYYGVILSDLFFNLRYAAPQRHYFEKELPTFKNVVDSLRFANGLNLSSSSSLAE